MRWAPCGPPFDTHVVAREQHVQKEDAGDRPWLCTLRSSHRPGSRGAGAGSMHLVSEGAGIELDVGDVFVGASAGVA